MADKRYHQDVESLLRFDQRTRLEDAAAKEPVVGGVGVAFGSLVSAYALETILYKGIVCWPANDIVRRGWGFPYVDDHGDEINPPVGTESGTYSKGILQPASLTESATPEYVFSSTWFADLYREEDPLVYDADHDLKFGPSDWQSEDGVLILSWDRHNRYSSVEVERTRRTQYVYKDNEIILENAIRGITSSYRHEIIAVAALDDYLYVALVDANNLLKVFSLPATDETLSQFDNNRPIRVHLAGYDLTDLYDEWLFESDQFYDDNWWVGQPQIDEVGIRSASFSSDVSRLVILNGRNSLVEFDVTNGDEIDEIQFRYPQDAYYFADQDITATFSSRVAGGAALTDSSTVNHTTSQSFDRWVEFKNGVLTERICTFTANFATQLCTVKTLDEGRTRRTLKASKDVSQLTLLTDYKHGTVNRSELYLEVTGNNGPSFESESTWTYSWHPTRSLRWRTGCSADCYLKPEHESPCSNPVSDECAELDMAVYNSLAAGDTLIGKDRTSNTVNIKSFKNTLKLDDTELETFAFNIEENGDKLSVEIDMLTRIIAADLRKGFIVYEVTTQRCEDGAGAKQSYNRFYRDADLAQDPITISEERKIKVFGGGYLPNAEYTHRSSRTLNTQQKMRSHTASNMMLHYARRGRETLFSNIIPVYFAATPFYFGSILGRPGSDNRRPGISVYPYIPNDEWGDIRMYAPDAVIADFPIAFNDIGSNIRITQDFYQEYNEGDIFNLVPRQGGVRPTRPPIGVI